MIFFVYLLLLISPELLTLLLDGALMAVSLKISVGPAVHWLLGTLFLAKKCGIGFGKTPAEEMVVDLGKSTFNSSSIRTALMICLGTILVFFICLEHSPESSKTSAVKYSMTAEAKMADSSLTIIPPFLPFLPVFFMPNIPLRFFLIVFTGKMRSPWIRFLVLFPFSDLLA